MRVKINPKINILMENVIDLYQRGIFVIIGDRAKDQVINLITLHSKISKKVKSKILWCYKNELGFSSHQNKRMKEISKLKKQGLYDSQTDSHFDQFINKNDISYRYYKDSQKILGQTFDFLILQDFEGISPNLLCRTIETVQGGGLIFFLIKSLTNLKQLYSLSSDIHTKFRTEKHIESEPRFVERFFLSLATNEHCLYVDDEMNILKLSSKIDKLEKIESDKLQELENNKKELIKLFESIKNEPITGKLLPLTATLDQAKALLSMLECISDGNSNSMFLSASRGRGKSAVLGLFLSACLALGKSNLFLSAPTSENLKTLFEFVVKGLETLDFKINMDFELFEDDDGNINKIILINKSKQILSYIEPKDYEKVYNAELVVIDEAAAIEINTVRKFVGNWPLFLSSTIHGYEGTGRSLSIKLVKEIKENKKGLKNLMKECSMSLPIRYAENDVIENWLYKLLCLEATIPKNLTKALPHPDNCNLYMVNKNTLFSYKELSEEFLFNLFSLFVSSHYKNQPNDLQLLSDAPGHFIFTLLGPIEGNGLPDILCAAHLSLEGDISKEVITKNSKLGLKPAGDLIAWKMKDYFLDNEFPRLTGFRIVRIATHPKAIKMGYGTKLLKQLEKFFKHELLTTDKDIETYDFFDYNRFQNISDKTVLNDNQVPIKKFHPILKNINSLIPPNINYLGTSFGITKNLYKFWKKNNYKPVYIKQTKTEETGEHSAILLKNLNNPIVDEKLELKENWIENYNQEFIKRFVNLLSHDFKNLDINLSIDILDPVLTTSVEEFIFNYYNSDELNVILSLKDIKRLESYITGNQNLSVIKDLIPILSKYYFNKRAGPNVKLSYENCMILLGLGLQNKSIEEIEKLIKNSNASKIMGLLKKNISRITKQIKEIYEVDIKNEMNFNNDRIKNKPLKKNHQDKLEKDGKEIIKKIYN